MENRWEGSEAEASHEMEILTYILDYLCSENQPDVSHPQLPNTKPLPSVKSLGPPPAKPPRPPVVNLQAFQRQAPALPKTHREGKEMCRAPCTASQQKSWLPWPDPRHLPLCIDSQGTVPDCFSVGLDIHHCLFSRRGCGSSPVK